MSRQARIERRTTETQITLSLELDGQGQSDVQTGVGFFDHMLQLLARHALWDLQVRAEGDLQVDAHHTVEDVGICLGQALAQALGDKAGIRRYGHAIIPMDETLVTAAVDLSGRAYLVWQVAVPPVRLGNFEAELAQDFWQAVVQHAAMNLHVLAHYGRNAHHLIEAVFKAVARALREAVELDPRQPGVPSTKGRLVG
jgi:imidazoleglycerol-phosphate dehydratase